MGARFGDHPPGLKGGILYEGFWSARNLRFFSWCHPSCTTSIAADVSPMAAAGSPKMVRLDVTTVA